MRVAELKALTREHGLRGYSRLRKAELIALLRPAPRTRPAVPGDPLHGGPCEWRPPRPLGDALQRPSRGLWPPAPWRPPPPPPQSVRFRPDRPRQPELMRRLEGIPTPPAPRPAGPHEQIPTPRPAPEFKPYQLKPKRDGIEPPIEKQ